MVYIKHSNINISDGHTTEDIRFKWRDMDTPVQRNENMQLPEFNLTDIKFGDCTAYYTTGKVVDFSQFNNILFFNESTIIFYNSYL